MASIQIFAGNFAPRGWMFCEGQSLPIANFSAIFSLLGTMYGGNGTTTFNLPDLRGRVPVGVGQGPGLPSITQGQMAGTAAHTLSLAEMPAHNHAATIQARLNGSADGPTTASPSNAYPATGTRAAPMDNIYAATNPTVAMGTSAVSATATIANAGNSQPHNNMQPYLGIRYIIAIEGIYPARN